MLFYPCYGVVINVYSVLIDLGIHLDFNSVTGEADLLLSLMTPRMSVFNCANKHLNIPDLFRYLGPFKDLEAEQIAEDVDAWWKLLYKLGKQLFEYPGAKRIADMVRSKVEKFKVLMPVLITICNKVWNYYIFSEYCEIDFFN